MPPCIEYQDGYRFQLRQTISIQTAVIPFAPVDLEYLSLDSKGKLTVKEGYAWDGASKTLNPRSGIRGSLFHDALYQLMRLELIDRDKYRIVADRILHDCCVADGMLPTALTRGMKPCGFSPDLPRCRSRSRRY